MFGISGGSESITIKNGPDEAWRFVRERILPKQSQCAWVVVQELPNQMKRPWIIRGRVHGRKPHLPIQPRLIRRDLDWPFVQRDRLGAIKIRPPGRGIIGNGGISPFKNDS